MIFQFIPIEAWEYLPWWVLSIFLFVLILGGVLFPFYKSYTENRHRLLVNQIELLTKQVDSLKDEVLELRKILSNYKSQNQDLAERNDKYEYENEILTDQNKVYKKLLDQQQDMVKILNEIKNNKS